MEMDNLFPMTHFSIPIFIKTSPVAFSSLGKSSYGLYKVDGNGWEWVADWYALFTEIGNSIEIKILMMASIELYEGGPGIQMRGHYAHLFVGGVIHFAQRMILDSIV